MYCSMFSYIIKRLLALIVTAFIIMSLAFIVVRAMPGSMFKDGSIRPKMREKLEQKYLLDKPIVVQYANFLKNAVKLDFGVSVKLYVDKPVFESIIDKIPITLQLNLFSLALFIPVGLFFGIWAGLKKNTLTDTVISTAVIFLISTPSFVFAALMQYFLAFRLGAFPLILSIDKSLTLEKFYSMILPILALSFSSIASLTRWMRAELTDALNSDYMLLAKSKGLTQIQATIRHAIKNSFIPLVNIIIPSFLGVLSGSLVIESIFVIPGTGRLMVSALSANDQPLYLACIIFYTIIGLVSILIMDLSYGIVDPRIRMGGGKYA